ncbi:hornerin [Drosophila subobscura]|uniref:hornerin n=1 Tax=Drosophila subobscura TaxID=7241 RepID=UPI00155A44D9|nr:hornerin [Drosophila subobscura]
MQFRSIPLAAALLSCCCCALLVNAAAPTDAVAKQSTAQSVTPLKLKRDAGLSFGSGLYHGPSHKYLPPGPSHSSSYDSGFGYASALHGNGLSSSSGYDFGHADTTLESYGGHHYGGHSSHGRPHYISSSSGNSGGSGGIGGGHHHQGPKVETYIVQTSGGSGSGHGHSYHGHGSSHGPIHGHGHGQGYGYSHGYGQGHGSGLSSGSGLGYKYSSHGSTGGGGGGGYLNLLGGHKPSSTYLVAGPEYSHSSHHGGSAGAGARPSYAFSSPHSSAGHGFSHGFGHGLSHGPSHGYALEHGSSHGHAIEHALEQGLSHALSLGHGGAQLGGYAHLAPSTHPSLEHHLGGEETSGYSYEAPSIGFGKSQPLSSYGVPLLPGYEHQQHPQHPLPDQVQVQVVEEQEHKAEQAAEEHQTPVYALGHKGLGHFSYTASKPQALHTDVLSSSGGHHHSNDISLNELSKAPFKPSAFLGAKHEPSSGPGSGPGSGYDYATPSNQYLQPPTSSGYDYQAPPQQVLYGAPGHSGDSATPIFEPEATYLPPVPTHGYH